MSNCCANSASVLSPRTAARATFALKAGVWFRRGRLVIVSPGLQPFWLLSGRNSTYPAVQISRASSIRRSDGKGGNTIKNIGVADDFQDADNEAVLSYQQAVARCLAAAASPG